MNLIDKYFELEKEIHEYFGYVEDWVVIPMVDHRRYYWLLDEKEGGDGHIVYYEEPLTDEVIDAGQYYDATIYTQRFLPKWVYRADDYTLICMDTHCDGNRFLGIFDNKKEQKEPLDDNKV